MNKHWYVVVPLLLFAVLFFSQISTTNASVSTADCYVATTGSNMPADDFNFNFTCTGSKTVYFGVCDSGFPDDTFQIEYKGNIVSESISSGAAQTISIGSATSDAGSNTATVLVTAPDDLGTYSYAVSSDYGEVANYMNTYCGFVLPIPTTPVGGTCDEAVPVFTADGAPSDGTLEFHILLGNEGEIGGEQIIHSWDLSEGDQLNNATVTGLSGPRYARVWWQADGSSDWYLLPSQYYHDGSSTSDEYGISCGDGQPSYHTSFSEAIPESAVCFDLLNGCN